MTRFLSGCLRKFVTRVSIGILILYTVITGIGVIRIFPVYRAVSTGNLACYLTVYRYTVMNGIALKPYLQLHILHLTRMRTSLAPSSYNLQANHNLAILISKQIFCGILLFSKILWTNFQIFLVKILAENLFLYSIHFLVHRLFC